MQYSVDAHTELEIEVMILSPYLWDAWVALPVKETRLRIGRDRTSLDISNLVWRDYLCNRSEKQYMAAGGISISGRLPD